MKRYCIAALVVFLGLCPSVVLAQSYTDAQWKEIDSVLARSSSFAATKAADLCEEANHKLEPPEFMDLPRPAGGAVADVVMRKDVEARLAKDQKLRVLNSAYRTQRLTENLVAVDEDNAKFLEKLLAAGRYPVDADIGKQGSLDLFYLIVHADRDPDLQRRGFKLMQDAANSRAISPGLPLMFKAVRGNVLAGKSYSEQYRDIDMVEQEPVKSVGMSAEQCQAANVGIFRTKWLREYFKSEPGKALSL